MLSGRIFLQHYQRPSIGIFIGIVDDLYFNISNPDLAKIISTGFITNHTAAFNDSDTSICVS